MSQAIDMTGQRFGRLTVIERAAPSTKADHAHWLCLCDCGNKIVVSRTSLIRGDRKSCGCLKSVKMELQYIKNDPNWKKDKTWKSMTCPYNEGVGCTKKECWKCGWNPKVAQARRERMEAKYGN